MGTDVADAADQLQYPYSFKMHRSLCVELLKLIDKITRLLPEIEEARPRCSGIQALVHLNVTVDRAKQILQSCCESSKLYLVITGDAVVSRCQKLRKILEQSLGQIESMVPTMLAAKISHIVDDAKEAIFTLDTSDLEAGKAMRELIQHNSSDSDEFSELEALRIAVSRLHITSQKDLLIERRSVRKLLDKVGDSDPNKKEILNYLLQLLEKHGKSILKEQTENINILNKGLADPVDSSNSYANSLSIEVGPGIGVTQDGAQAGIMSRGVPPVEFKCPISMRLMYDPVVIASGETFERFWIQKWFEEGNDTCPKTKAKLTHLALVPNIAMKESISKWCEKYEVTIADPTLQNFSLLDVSSASIASLSISMNGLHLPVDVSNMSIGSLDSSYILDSSQTRVADRSHFMPTENTDDFHGSQHETDSEFLTGLSKLEWDSQRERVENVTSQISCIDRACSYVSSENFVEPLIGFLRHSQDRHDVTAQRAGCQLLLEFVSRNRSGALYLNEDAFSLLVSLLDSEAIGESLAILEVSSREPCCRSKIALSGALVPLMDILDSKQKEHQELAVKVLHNLSSSSDICTQIVYLECIPKLVPFINEGSIAKHCIALLKNLCGTEEARAAVAETEGCIASIAALLESGSREEQELGVSVLLSLCTQRVEYCKLVMDEGIISSLFDISVNGNDKGKAVALELLRQLRDVDFGSEKPSEVDANRDVEQQIAATEERSSRTSGFFRVNISRFRRVLLH